MMVYQEGRTRKPAEASQWGCWLIVTRFQAFILSAPMFGRVHKHLDNKQQQPFAIETAAAVVFTSGGFCPQDDPTVSIFTKNNLVTRVRIKKWLWKRLIEAPLK